MDTSRALGGNDKGKNGRRIGQSNAFIQSTQSIDQRNSVNSALSPKTNSADYSEPCTIQFSVISDFASIRTSLPVLLPFQEIPDHPCIPLSNQQPIPLSLPLCPSRNPSSPPSSHSWRYAARPTSPNRIVSTFYHPVGERTKPVPKPLIQVHYFPLLILQGTTNMSSSRWEK
jgi:hypothetical protein